MCTFWTPTAQHPSYCWTGRAGVMNGLQSCVVGVFGSAHLAGICNLWKGKAWEDICLSLASRKKAAARDTSLAQVRQAGMRRALLASAMRLRADADVIQDMARQLPPLPEGQQREFQDTLELYGQTRMLLATLSHEQLAEVWPLHVQ